MRRPTGDSPRRHTSRALALIKEDEHGETMTRLLRDVAGEGGGFFLEVVRSWGAAIEGFFPDAPSSFVVETRLVGRGLPLKEVRNIRAEFRETRIVLLGRPQEVGGQELKALIRHAWIDELLTPDSVTSQRATR